MAAFLKLLAVSTVLLFASGANTTSTNNCMVHGCKAYQHIYDSVGPYVSSTFAGYPGVGSGECECDGLSCEDMVPCTVQETYVVSVPNGTVRVNGGPPASQATFVLAVADCGADDYRSLVIDPGNGQGLEYGLVALGCCQCRGQYCPASP